MKRATKLTNPLRKIAVALLAVIMAAALALPWGAAIAPVNASGSSLGVSLVPSAAWADDSDDSDSSDEDRPLTAYELQQKTEEAQAEYADARTAADEAAKQVEDHEARIKEIEEQIPEQQKRSGKATRELYKFQQQGVGLLNMLLGAGSFQDFVNQIEYITRITDENYAEINRLFDMKRELSDTREQLKQARDDADARVDEARTAMEVAQEAQAEAQRRVEEEARIAAEAALTAAELATNPRDNDATSGGTSGGGSSNPGAESGGSGGNSGGDSGNSGGNPIYGGGETGDEAAFINNWAPRIDAYLAGSPMAGQGYTFAKAAYTYNVDPRFSPAIACTESGKGRQCFLPYNAWGWGSVSWSSWEEAINGHVRGLSRGYGYTISIEGAKMYCPPNWEHWYNTTLSQMNLI